MSITDRLAQINGKSQGQIPRLVGRAESSLSIRERSPGLDLSLSEEPNRQQEDTYHFIIRITHKNYVHVRTLRRLNTKELPDPDSSTSVHYDDLSHKSCAHVRTLRQFNAKERSCAHVRALRQFSTKENECRSTAAAKDMAGWEGRVPIGRGNSRDAPIKLRLFIKCLTMLKCHSNNYSPPLKK